MMFWIGFVMVVWSAFLTGLFLGAYWISCRTSDSRYWTEKKVIDN